MFETMTEADWLDFDDTYAYSEDDYTTVNYGLFPDFEEDFYIRVVK